MQRRACRQNTHTLKYNLNQANNKQNNKKNFSDWKYWGNVPISSWVFRTFYLCFTSLVKTGRHTQGLPSEGNRGRIWLHFLSTNWLHVQPSLFPRSQWEPVMCTLWKTIDILKQAEGRILTGSHSVDQANLKHAMSLRLVLNLWLSSCLSFAGAEDYRCELPHIFLFF